MELILQKGRPDQESGRLEEATVCKNLFLCNRQKTQFYLLMIPGGKVFHTKDLSAQIGSARLSFADPVCWGYYIKVL